MVGWKLSQRSVEIQDFKVDQRLETFQEHCRKDQTQLFQPKNSRNCQQEL